MKKISKIILSFLLPLSITFSGCGACELVEQLIGYEMPDISLIEEYVPTRELKIASYAKHAPEFIVLQSGILDVHKKVVEKIGHEISGMRVASKENGIYVYYTDEKFAFNMGLLSYDFNSFDLLLTTDNIPADFTFNGSTDTVSAFSYLKGEDYNIVIIPFGNEKSYSVFTVEDKNESLRAIYQGGNGEFIIKTRLYEYNDVNGESVETVINKMYMFNSVTNTVEKFTFEEGGDVYVGAGQNMAIVCAQPSSSWYIVREENKYKKENFSDEINELINSSKFLKIVGDYFVIGNPCEKESKVFSFTDKNMVGGELEKRVKEIASNMVGNMFNASYNRYKKSFTFERGKTGEKQEVNIFENEGVPEILKTISVAQENRRESGIVQVTNYENTGEENIFDCVYFDEKGCKIHCIFTYDFESKKIDYVGACGEGSSLINLPGSNGIEIVLYK